MTKLTTERLEELANATTPSVKYVGREIIAMARRLLAYEQAAKNPVAWVATDSEGFPEYSGHNEFSSSCGVGTPLYAAPVLPKQPEHSRQHFESLCNQFWNWAELDEIDQDEEPRLEWNGSNYTHRVTAALWKMYQAASAQPVIPEQPQRISDDDLIAVPRSVLACAGYAYGKAGLKDSNAYAQLRSYFFAPAITAQLAIPEQNKFRDLSQPVDPQISEYEKIMLQPDNSPVIPDAYVLDELGRMTLNGVC